MCSCLLLTYTHTKELRCISLDRLAGNKDGNKPALRTIEFFAIPRNSGDCVILLLAHPGLNVLGRFLPPSKINDLLLGDSSRARPSSSHADVYMTGIEEPDFFPEIEAFDIMDLASFLEYVGLPLHTSRGLHAYCGAGLLFRLHIVSSLYTGKILNMRM